jgi:ATP-dependent Lhr-like helicase
VGEGIARLVEEGRLVEGAFLPGGTGPELCDRQVLDALRHKSLAKVRRAIAPASPAVFARLVCEWQGLLRPRRGREALLAVVAELQGCPLVASSLETEILPARLQGYQSWDLDALCASGHVVWAGIDPLGQSDGRLALYLAETEALLARPAAHVGGELAAAVRRVLARRGAIFFAELSRELGGLAAHVLEVVWRMVWAGEITNDTLEPLRSRMARQSHKASRGHHARRRSTPPGLAGSEGRWSLRASRWTVTPSATDQSMAVTGALLDRYGIVTREAAHAEGIPGGFASIYPVLKALEDQGRVRRGYFVDGRGGAQFARPGADDRLRGLRDDADPRVALVLAATDPANAWGTLLDWPEPMAPTRPQRAAGARVVVRNGELLGWLGPAEHPLLTFLPEPEVERAEAASTLAASLAGLVDGKRRRALLIATIDGMDARDSALAPAFVHAGFTIGGRGLLKRGP